MIIIWFYLLNPARPHLFWSPMQVTLIYTSMTVPSSPTVPTRLDLINDLALCCNLASHGVVTTLPVGRVDGGGGQLDHQVHEECGEGVHGKDQ